MVMAASDMQASYFTIRVFPEDVYPAVGQIIRAAQEWERDFKALVRLTIPGHVRNIDGSPLNKLNDALLKYEILTEREYRDLKGVIEDRNYINHRFFLEDFAARGTDYDAKLRALEDRLNHIQHMIFEAADLTANKCDAHSTPPRTIGANRPTVFDPDPAGKEEQQ